MPSNQPHPNLTTPDPAEAVALPDAAQDALARVRQYVAMHEAKPLRQNGDVIHGIHTGTEWEAELRLSDLRALSDIMTSPAPTDREPSKWASVPATRAELESVIRPRPLSELLEAYWCAPGSGPLNGVWKNKPHRIVYDLIAAHLHQEAEVTRLRAALSAIAEARSPDGDATKFATASDMRDYASAALATPSPADATKEGE